MRRPLLLCLLTVVALGCGRGQQASLPAAGSEPIIGVRAEKPARQLMGDAGKATAQIRSKNEATLSAPASGTVTKVHVAPGARVEKGAALAQLDSSNLVIQLDQAKAARRIAAAGRQTAETELERTRKLHEGGSAPASVLERASAGLEQGDAALAQADAAVRSVEELLRDHTVRAPFAGVVTARLKNVGDYVAMMPPTPMFSLVDVDHLEVRANVPEAVALQLKNGQTISGRSIPQGLPFEAKVTSIGAVVDPTSRSIEILADITSAGQSGVIRPGALAELGLGTGDTQAQGIFLASTAVLTEGDKRYLWVVEGDKVARREVTVEPATPRFFRVQSGLTGDELVVTEGGASLTAGQRVRVVGPTAGVSASR